MKLKIYLNEVWLFIPLNLDIELGRYIFTQIWCVERQEILGRVAEVDDEEKEDLTEVSPEGSGEGERDVEFSLFWTESLFSFVASFVLLLTGKA